MGWTSIGYTRATHDEFSEKNLKQFLEDEYINRGINFAMIHMEKGFEEASKWYDDEIKTNNLEEVEIEYELCNHEAYYTGEIEDTVDALDGRYTAEEVQKVYNKNKHLHYDD